MAHMVGKIRWDDIHWEKKYDKMQAYNDSKLANLLHAKELAKRLKDKGIIVVSLHPGKNATTNLKHIFGNMIITDNLYFLQIALIQ